jgi:apolipoprotein D and lipocalin family protein
MNRTTPLLAALAFTAVTALTAFTAARAAEPPAAPPPLQPLPSLDVPSYMGTWYQVAWFPNRFQKQCVSDTQAQYRQRDDGRIEVLNRCRLADGRLDEASGIARPAGSTSA